MVADANNPNNPNSQNGNHRPQQVIPKCGARGQKRIYVFAYQPDITTSELAASIEIVMFGFAVMIRVAQPAMVDILYDALDEKAKRHWLVKELSNVAVAQKPKGLHLPPGAMGD